MRHFYTGSLESRIDHYSKKRRIQVSVKDKVDSSEEKKEVADEEDNWWVEYSTVAERNWELNA